MSERPNFPQAPDADADPDAEQEPSGGRASTAVPSRRSIGNDLALALLPTLTILVVFGVLERFAGQQLLFTSLASSAFLIYLNPRHATNRVRTLVLAQGTAAVSGVILQRLLYPGFGAAAAAMVLTIVVMILINALHPPAVSTSLAFSFYPITIPYLAMFGLAVGLIVTLIALQRVSVYLLKRSESRYAKLGRAMPMDRAVGD